MPRSTSTAAPTQSDQMGWLALAFLGPDPERHINLKISLGGQLGYVCNICLLWYAAGTGLIGPHLTWPITLVMVATMAAFYLTIRSGLSRRFSDPGLAVTQMVTAGALSVVGYVLSPALHIALLTPVATTLAYSVFALQGRQVRLVQVITMGLFICASAVMCHLQPQFYKPYIEVQVLATLALTVMMLTWSGSRMAQLRALQRQKREELTGMLDRIETLASRDTLTGLPNRRHMNVLLAHHAERALRGDASPTLALIDLDHFKQVNDHHGHAVGDEALQHFARTTLALLPATDTLARWGGEEFMLLSTATPAEVLALLARVRTKLGQTPASVQQPALRIGFSAGVAVHGVQQHITATIQRADQALYRAKHAGRAQSCLADVGDPPNTQEPTLPAAPAYMTAAPRTAPLRPMQADSPTEGATAFQESRSGDAAYGNEGTDPSSEAPRLAWLLGRESRHRVWTARSMIGAIPYLFGILSVLYLMQVGNMAADTAWQLVIGLSLTPLLVYALVRSGWTARYEDPVITFAQMLAAITWTAILYVTTSHSHPTQLILLVMLVTVSVCNMSRSKAWAVCLYAMALMTAAMWTMSRLEPALYAPKVELANWILMMSNLPMLMLMGRQLSKLHARLRTQRTQLREAVERLSQLATHDELTGLHNRGYLNEMLAHYGRRARHGNEVFTLALIDLDHFKQINDQHGHTVGDEVLQAFARLAASTLRQIDVIARWGGEEFLVLWPQTTPEQAIVGLERLRKAFANLQISQAVPSLRASFSAGLASPHAGDANEQTLACADEALYQAKRAGRNRTCVHGAASTENQP